MVVLSIASLCSCDKDKETILNDPIIEDSIPPIPLPTTLAEYHITLKEDFEIQEVSFFESNVLVWKSNFEYSDSLIIKSTYNYLGGWQQDAYYSIQDKLATIRIDSIFRDSLFTSIWQIQYLYDESGYLIESLGLWQGFENGILDFEENTSVTYYYRDGNCRLWNVGSEYGEAFTHNLLDNQLNIYNFMGAYLGKIDKNLRKEYFSGYHSSPSTDPGWSAYSWVLDENGLVKQCTEILTSSYYIPDEEPTKSKIITDYIYTFVDE